MVDTLDSEKKEEIREVIESTIVETEQEAQMYGEIVQELEQEKQDVIEKTNYTVECLENDGIYYSYLAQKKWLEVAKLKQLSKSL